MHNKLLGIYPLRTMVCVCEKPTAIQPFAVPSMYMSMNAELSLLMLIAMYMSHDSR